MTLGADPEARSPHDPVPAAPLDVPSAAPPSPAAVHPEKSPLEHPHREPSRAPAYGSSGRAAAADRALTVLGLGGSTRAGSAAERLLRTALDAAGREGMATELFALGHRDVPVFRESLLLDPPPVVAELLAAVRRADAVVFCTPVYHGTVAGALKNAVDHLQALAGDDRPWLTGKAAALMAVGGTPLGGANAITAMDHFCRSMHATTVPTAVVAGHGSWAPADLDERVTRMIGELAVHARGLSRAEATPQRA
ncbi:hypothetical protein CD934_00745 [Streptomyces calvus]|uniref:NADPH-dependent FMN reductase-like domain-containing protein n=1 Tax=Streptomyces calvus TaxID=67282 RepID=A0A514JJ63_9ACTN|nr:NAD(P)H-dependent oxidoreductase [Streptomyces calvus]QDI67367.1 hypothetical protein CD934_00745 [Streptomyces calvus]